MRAFPSEKSHRPPRPPAAPNFFQASELLALNYEQIDRTYELATMIAASSRIKERLPEQYAAWHQRALEASSMVHFQSCALSVAIAIFYEEEVVPKYWEARDALEPALIRQNELMAELILMLNEGKPPAPENVNTLRKIVHDAAGKDPATFVPDSSDAEPFSRDFSDPIRVFDLLRSSPVAAKLKER